MIGLVQRVREARVEVGGRTIGQIGPGMLLLVCAEPADTELQVERMLPKLLRLRIFSDDAGKMNRSLQGIAGGLLVVSQFTLVADGSGGNRPSFTRQFPPRGLPPLRLADLTCPIGIAGIRSKHPAAIAASVAAQLLQIREARAAIRHAAHPGPDAPPLSSMPRPQ